MVTTPKQNPNSRVWYRYYAGYTEEFVASLIGHLGIRRNSWVLDPWNGAGTTTAVAHRLGYKSIGLDVNPALVLIGKARSLDVNVLPSIAPLCADIWSKATDLRRKQLASSEDPLRCWFSARSANTLRCIEAAINELLVSEASYVPLTSSLGMAQASSLASFFYQALFLSVRHFLGEFTTTNPTWITKATNGDFVTADARVVHRLFREATAHLASCLTKASLETDRLHSPVISLGRSEQIRAHVGQVGAVIGSPPYCTRIDYAVNTLPELAVLRFGSVPSEFRLLRNQMMGTPTMTSVAPEEPLSCWGAKAGRFVADVTRHASKASSTYYRKYFLQYYDSLYRSLESIAGVLRPGGACAIVVQDSYYKEVHNDLAGIVQQMGATAGMPVVDRLDFSVPRVRAQMNARARAYRSNFTATESAVILKRSREAQ